MRTGVADTPTKGPEQVVAKPIKSQFRDQAVGVKMLAQAEASYKAFNWDAARSNAEHILSLDVEPKVMARARAITLGAPELEKLFEKLNDWDELTRNYDTSPGLVKIDSGSDPIYAVPVSGGDAKEPVLVEHDPVGYIKSAMRAGAVQVMMLGKTRYIWGQLPDAMTSIVLVDQAEVHKEKSLDFQDKLGALRNSTKANDATAWYSAARFAYQNRLDDQVTDMLDKALDLDPFLVRTVREEKAEKYCSAMLMQLKLGNKVGAQAWLGLIKSHYKDTQQGQQAVALFDGNMHQIVAMEQSEEQLRKQQEEERMQERIQRAKQDGDAAKVAQIQQEKPATEMDSPAQSDSGEAPVTGDEGVAKTAMDKGLPIYREAIDMPATSARNDKYKAAEAFFKQAAQVYAKLLEKSPNDEDLASKMVEARKLWFGCEKYQTVF